MDLIDLLNIYPYSKESVDAVKVLFEEFYPDIKSPELKNFIRPYSLQYKDYGTITQSDFFNLAFKKNIFVPDEGNPDPTSTPQFLSTMYQKMLLYEQFYKEKASINPENTTINPDELSELEESAERELARQAEARRIGTERARSFVDSLKRSNIGSNTKSPTVAAQAQEQTPKPTPVQAETIESPIFITPIKPIDTVKLTPQDRKDLSTLVTAAKYDPNFEKRISIDIQKNLNSRETKDGKKAFLYGESEAIGTTVAHDLIERLRLFDENAIPDTIAKIDLATPLASITRNEKLDLFDTPESLLIAKTAIAETIEIHKTYTQLANTLVSPIIGETLSGAMFVPYQDKSEENFEASTEKKPGSMFEYSRKSVERIKELSVIKSQLLYELEQEGITLSDKEIEKSIRQIAQYKDHYQRLLSLKIMANKNSSPVPGMHYPGTMASQGNYLSTLSKLVKVDLQVVKQENSVVLQMGLNVTKNHSVAFKALGEKFTGSKVGTLLGKAVNITPQAVKLSIQSSVKTAIVSVSTKIAAKLGVQAIAAAIGSIAPIIGTILGWIIGTILGEVLWRAGVWIKRHWKAFLGLLSLPFLAAGSLLGSVALGGVGLALGIESMVGIKAASVIATKGTLGIIKSFTQNIIINIGTTLIVGFIVLLITVSALVFIINTSAYMVPPGGGTNVGGGKTGGGGGGIPTQCNNNNDPKPTGVTPRLSADGNFAFPAAPQDQTYYYCHHSHQKAVDVYTKTSMIPEVAYTSGTIELVVENDPLGGRYIILAGDDGRYYYYAHNCQNFVTKGQRVTVGEVIATTDSTGNAVGTPEHIHFAINDSSTFPAGTGVFCPQADFEEKFNMGVCDIANTCY